MNKLWENLDLWEFDEVELEQFLWWIINIITIQWIWDKNIEITEGFKQTIEWTNNYLGVEKIDKKGIDKDIFVYKNSNDSKKAFELLEKEGEFILEIESWEEKVYFKIIFQNVKEIWEETKMQVDDWKNKIDKLITYNPYETAVLKHFDTMTEKILSDIDWKTIRELSFDNVSRLASILNELGIKSKNHNLGHMSWEQVARNKFFPMYKEAINDFDIQSYAYIDRITWYLLSKTKDKKTFWIETVWYNWFEEVVWLVGLNSDKQKLQSALMEKVRIFMEELKEKVNEIK